MLFAEEHLEWYKCTNSEKYDISFNIWCPERIFDAFHRKCRSWAQHLSTKGIEYALPSHHAFSEELLQANDVDTRLQTVNFSVGASHAPFHVLGLEDESMTPWRQSAPPWYAHASCARQEIYNPLSGVTAHTHVFTCRMIMGMIRVSYNREKQSLAIHAKFCAMQNSRSFTVTGSFIPLGCDQQAIAQVQPKVLNKAKLMAQHLAETADQAPGQ